MIVLDEQIRGSSIAQSIATWYVGQVVAITALRPKTVIEDDSLPTLLRTASHPTFVTINVADFWRTVPADPHYAVVCIDLPAWHVSEITDWLRRLFRVPIFKTKAMRMGKVARLRPSQIEYYEANWRLQTPEWPE
jgi:hypothetical protein